MEQNNSVQKRVSLNFVYLLSSKFFLLFVFVCTLSSNLNAQITSSNIDVKWSEELHPVKSRFMEDMGILKSDENYIYYLWNTDLGDTYNQFMWSTSVEYLVKFDRKNNKNTLVELKLKTDRVKRNVIKVSLIGNSIHVISTLIDKKQKKCYVLDETVDMETFKLKNDAHKISEIDYNGIKGIDEKKIYVNFSIYKDRILFDYNFDSSIGSYYGFEVFNKPMSSEWKFKDKAQAGSGITFEGQYVFDNDGNLYASLRNFENERDANRHYERSKLFIKFYPKDGSQPKIQEVKLPGNKFVTAQQLAVNDKNELICAGLYAIQGNESAVGAFSVISTPRLQLMGSFNDKAFDNAFLTKGLNSKDAANLENKSADGKEFEEDFTYKFNNIHFRNDGGFDLVAEKCKLLIETIFNSQQGTTYRYYHTYDDILVLTCNSDGSFNWVQRIPKNQYVVNVYHFLGSYLLSYGQNDEMNFMYNLIKTNRFTKKPTDESKIVMLSLDSNGKESFKELFTDFKLTNSICPKFSVSLGESKYLISRINMNTIGKNTLFFGEMKLN